MCSVYGFGKSYVLSWNHEQNSKKKPTNNQQKMCCGAEEHVLVEIPGFIFHKQPADLWQEAAHMQDL